MKKVKSSVIFFVILFFIVIIMGIKDKVVLKDNEYVVSGKENTNKENILQNSEKLNSFKEENINSEKQYTSSNIEEVNDEMVTIYISGEVKKSGLITIKKDTRLGEAIEFAGGLDDSADLNKVNMALKVKDEYHYIIPKIGEDIKEENLVNQNENQNNYNRQESKEQKININLASIDELDDLPGVGEATANKIIKYREENGEFKSVEEIKSVNGIGDKKYEDIKDLISIN